MKSNVLIIFTALLALLGGVAARAVMSPEPQASQVSLPELSLPDLSGKTHSLSEWQGKVRVINFWATWCPPCLKEMPAFVELQNKFANQGLQFIGIALDDPEPVKAFIADKKINYPILIGGDQGTKIAHNLGNVVDTVPFTVIVNKQGQVVLSKMGEMGQDEILSIIVPLLSAK